MAREPRHMPRGAHRCASPRAPRWSLPFILLSLSFPPEAGAQSEPLPVVLHVPPTVAREGQDLSIVATLTGGTAANGVVFYRLPEEPFRRAPMVSEGDRWRATIPGDRVRPPYLEYYLRMETVEGETAFDPPVRPEDQPFAVPVQPGSGRVVPLSPGPGERTQVLRPEIVALFEPPLPSTDGVFILLDRQDVTASARIEADVVVLQPVAPLAPGEHEVRVFFRDEKGASGEGRWSFFIGQAPRRLVPRFTLHGRAEFGWGMVREDESDSTEAYLPYTEESGPLVNVQTYGRLGGEDLLFTVNRDPIYQRKARWLLRLNGPRHAVEFGSVFPFLAESAVAWQFSDGFTAEAERGRYKTQLVGVRMVKAGLSGGVATYDRYLVGTTAGARAGALGTSLTAAYAFDDRGSLPDEVFQLPDSAAPYIVPAIRNLVWVWSGEVGGDRRGAHVEVGRSSIGDRDRDEDAWTARVSLEDRRKRGSWRVEYRVVRPEYVAVGNPALHSGEKGVFADLRLAGDQDWRTTLHLERYANDDPSARAQEEPTTQVWWNLELGNDGAASAWPVLYLILRHSDIPYVDAPFRSDYLNLGTYARRGSWPWSLSGSLTRTREIGETRLWTLNGQLWYRPPGGAFDARLGLRADRTRDNLGDADRWRLTLIPETGFRAGDIDLRTSLQWIRQEDHIDAVRSYRETLLSFTAGRSF